MDLHLSHGFRYHAGFDSANRLLSHPHAQEVDIGLAADIGSLQRLPRVTSNASLLYELALTARTFGPAEAKELGLVSRVVSGSKGVERVRHEAIELAKVIAGGCSRGGLENQVSFGWG